MEDFDVKSLQKWGIQSISVSYPDLNITSIDGEELAAVRLNNGPKYNLELELDNAGLTKLQEALSNAPRTDAEETQRELKIMNKVMNCEGDNLNEKIDTYFAGIDEKVVAMQTEYAERIRHYILRHR